MLLFFGTRASKIKARSINGSTECPYCKNQNSFVATTFGRYLHLFWIPMFPLHKTTTLECSHCKRTYVKGELQQGLKLALLKSDEVDPPKRPLWHGCGCLVLAAIGLIIVLLSITSDFFWSNKEADEVIDKRVTSLHEDTRKTTVHLNKNTDSIF